MPRNANILPKTAGHAAAVLLLMCTALLAQDAQPQAVPDRGLLGQEYYVNGSAVSRAFEPLVESARQATVQVIRDAEPVILGSVVSQDGLIVTKASELEGGRSFGVSLHDGRSFRAKLITTDTANDLALLRIDAKGLPVVQWAEGDARPQIGEWVAAPTAGGHETLAGLISAERRAVPREGGVIGIQMYTEGGANGGVTVELVLPDSGADAAGLIPEDIITHINGAAVAAPVELKEQVDRYAPGETVRVAYTRGGERHEAEVRLGERGVVFKDFFFDRNTAISGDVSRRRNGFTAVLQHHIPLSPSQCGGPLVGLHGRVVGINIARVNRSETYALPADVVKQALARLRNEAQ